MPELLPVCTANHAHVFSFTMRPSLPMCASSCRRAASLLGGSHVAKLQNILSSAQTRRPAIRRSLGCGIGDISSEAREGKALVVALSRQSPVAIHAIHLHIPALHRRGPDCRGINKWNHPRKQTSVCVRMSPLGRGMCPRSVPCRVGPDS